MIFSTAWSVSVTRSTEFFLLPTAPVEGLEEAVVMCSPDFRAISIMKSCTCTRLMSAMVFATMLVKSHEKKSSVEKRDAE